MGGGGGGTGEEGWPRSCMHEECVCVGGGHLVGVGWRWGGGGGHLVGVEVRGEWVGGLGVVCACGCVGVGGGGGGDREEGGGERERGGRFKGKRKRADKGKTNIRV